MKVRNRRDAEPFVTIDGSTIREIIHPNNVDSVHQSLAEAKLEPSSSTLNHLHSKSEEIYYVLKGTGRMHLDTEELIVGVNDAIYIPPGTKHFIENTGEEDLIFLCCSTPPYSNEDTDIK